MTLKEKFIAALTKRGETKVKETFRYVVFTRKEGGNYYIGRNGALRRGFNIGASIPCSEALKENLIRSLRYESS